MSESFIEPESLNSTLVSLDAILDDDGAVRLLNKELSSYNFDGVIPTTASTILVSQLEVGMSFLPIGETEGALRTVVKIEFDDPEMTDTPSTDYIISYLSPSGDIQSITYDGSQNIEVYFEDWEDKVLGTKGWLITQEGNAIFSNVAVRGRIEATEGLIDGDLVVNGSLSTSETADTEGGIVFDSTGIFAYDTDGNNTFLLDATTGDITIFGTPGDDLLTGEDVSDDGTTIISANRITTGSVTGRVFRSNSTMTPTSGTGIYLDGNNNVRFSDPDATFTFNSSGLNITNGSNATLTFNSTGLSITGAGVTIGGENPDNFITGTDVGPSGTTTISGDRITTGSIESSAPDFIWNGISTFSTQGTRFSVNDGQIISEQFRIDSAGNAEFGGTLVAADGTFTGTLSAADGTFTGTLSAADGTFTGTLSGVDGTFEGTLSAGISISSPTISGGSISGTLFTTGGSNRVTLSDATSAFGADALNFYSGGSRVSSLYWASGLSFLGVSSNLGVFGALSAQSTFLVSGASTFVGAIGCGNINGSRITMSSNGNALAPSNFTNAQTALQIRVSDNVIGIQSSTLDIKTNIIPLNEEILSIVPKEKSGGARENLSFEPDDIFTISPVEYVVIEDETQSRQVGFIVEDLLEKWPQAVTYGKDNTPVSYNTNSIVAGLVYAVKKQKQLIEELEERINSLELSANG